MWAHAHGTRRVPAPCLRLGMRTGTRSIARSAGGEMEGRGGGAWESNPPRTVCRPYSGFEVRGRNERGPLDRGLAGSGSESFHSRLHSATENPGCSGPPVRQPEPDLAIVIEQWAQLPEAVRGAIIALVRHSA